MISFYVHKDKVEIDEETYYLGELSADFLNIMEEYEPAHNQYDVIKQCVRECDKDTSKKNINSLTSEFEKLLDILEPFKLFRIINKEYREINSVMREIGEFGFMKMFEDILDVYPDYEKEAEKEDSNMYPSYKKRIEDFALHLHDIRAFNHTIHFFIKEKLMKVKNLSEDSHALAYLNFINSPYAQDWIANPIRHGDMIYRTTDFYNISYVPRKIEKDSDEYAIYEFIEVDDLQSFLKLDFMRAMINGHTFRRCQHCRKYFMITKKYHTMYCDKPSPENQNYTCHQVGSMTEKERAANVPKTQSMKRAFDRVGHDFRRGLITEMDKDKLFGKIADMHHKAITSVGTSNIEFEESLKTGVLYEQCRVERKSKPRGRPKKTEDIKADDE